MYGQRTTCGSWCSPSSVWVLGSNSNDHIWRQEPLSTELSLRSHLQNSAIEIHAQFAFVYGESVIKLVESWQDFSEVHSSIFENCKITNLSIYMYF